MPRNKNQSPQPDIPLHLSPFKIFKLLALIIALMLTVLVALEGGHQRRETWRKWRNDQSIPSLQPTFDTLPSPTIFVQTQPISSQLPSSYGRPGKTVPGKVTVELLKQSFRVGEIVRPIIANGLNQPVYTQDQQSYCSIVTVERFQFDTWEKIPGCGEQRSPRVVEIGPGKIVETVINPYSGIYSQGKYPPAYGEGRYRIAFSYILTPRRTETTTASTVTSPEFVVKGPPLPTPTQYPSEKFFDEVQKRMQLVPTDSIPMMGDDSARCDFDGDGDCDAADRAFFQARIGACRGDTNYYPLADG